MSAAPDRLREQLRAAIETEPHFGPADVVASVMPVVQAWAAGQTQRANDLALEAITLAARLRMAEAAVQRVRGLAKAARGVAGALCTCPRCEAEDWNPDHEPHEPTWTGWNLDPAQVLATLDRPETDPPKPCPLGLRLHTPHTWTDGGPIRDCPGITDQPEEASG